MLDVLHAARSAVALAGYKLARAFIFSENVPNKDSYSP